MSIDPFRQSALHLLTIQIQDQERNLCFKQYLGKRSAPKAVPHYDDMAFKCLFLARVGFFRFPLGKYSDGKRRGCLDQQGRKKHGKNRNNEQKLVLMGIEQPLIQCHRRKDQGKLSHLRQSHPHHKRNPQRHLNEQTGQPCQPSFNQNHQGRKCQAGPN